MQLKTIILLLLFSLIKVFLFCENVKGMSDSEFMLQLTLKYLKSHRSTFWICDKIYLVSKNYFCKDFLKTNSINKFEKRKRRRFTIGETSTKSLNKEVRIVEFEREGEENQLNKHADTIMEAIVLIVEDESIISYKKAHSIICIVRRGLIDIMHIEESKGIIEKCEDEEAMKHFGKHYGKQYNEKIENIIKSIEEIQKIRRKKYTQEGKNLLAVLQFFQKLFAIAKPENQEKENDKAWELLKEVSGRIENLSNLLNSDNLIEFNNFPLFENNEEMVKKCFAILKLNNNVKKRKQTGK
ncbi:hypothetical protein ACQ4LE_004492 [Meloidogyne hapla]